MNKFMLSFASITISSIIGFLYGNQRLPGQQKSALVETATLTDIAKAVSQQSEEQLVRQQLLEKGNVAISSIAQSTSRIVEMFEQSSQSDRTSMQPQDENIRMMLLGIKSEEARDDI